MSITIYAHHVMHDSSVFAEDNEEVDEQLRALGHDWSEEWFFTDDMQHALLIAEFGGSQDVVGDIDDEARAVLGMFDSVHYVAAGPPAP